MHLIPTLVRIITTEVMETTKISSLPAIIIFLYYKEMVFLSHVHWKPAVIMLLGPDLSNRENITASIFNVMLWFGETSFRTFSPSEISCFGASSCQHKLIAVTKLPNWVFSSAEFAVCTQVYTIQDLGGVSIIGFIFQFWRIFPAKELSCSLKHDISIPTGYLQSLQHTAGIP